MTAPPIPKMSYRIHEVAEMTSMSVDKVRRAIAAGDLAAHKPGRIVLVQHAAIQEWLDAMPSWGE